MRTKSVLIPALSLICFSAGLLFANQTLAKEIRIGAKEMHGMEIGAVYLQPVEMEPANMMRAAKDSDVHMEADIKALEGNTNGFSKDSWIPYLGVSYELTNISTKESQKGEFMPMVANDGPHYGDNIKLSGPGKYKLKLTISPPSENKHAHFGRHTDKETGTCEWFKTFSVEYEFTYTGTGKKGAY